MESGRLKSEFLATMSHELRTPLNHVIGFTDLVMEEAGPALSAEHREYLGDVQCSGRHLLSLINDVLDMARVESGKIDLAYEEVALRDLLRKSLSVVTDSAARGGVTLSAEVDGIPLSARLDARRITQVLYNLLSNAMKFTPRGGSVNLQARPLPPAGDAASKGPEPGRREVSATDTGIGLRVEELERVFGPFERVRSPVTQALPGTGLGLTLARKYVELHGGRLWAESGGEGKGSTFRFTLPLAPGPEFSPGPR